MKDRSDILAPVPLIVQAAEILCLNNLGVKFMAGGHAGGKGYWKFGNCVI
jgi:hypothetical protein